ncbi:LysM peptidoglycan-binding domain-containing protein [Rhodohalobacter sp. SW132]|uniref:CsgE family curli-type amyloid fiber assembly protein n=1 Tax=Rhodohalobacter sp. SW132 TaxID=2293433 RepID=UPI000E28412E|nr:CsgE family curli-type amyloid fiber assembly protein [Rhodohalobacter sp. SW132]REL39255.1 LysM peptidoglycan-binding domain-containing protein [Rhodohalobacter sp. SW132]
MQYSFIILVLALGIIFPSTESDYLSGPQEDSLSGCEEDSHRYTVQPGDKLHEIGAHYGNPLFWEAIYIANADQIGNPNLIFVGQTLRIPARIANFASSGQNSNLVLDDPFCDLSLLPLASADPSHLFLYNIDELKQKAEPPEDELLAETQSSDSDIDSSSVLDTFRDAFEAVIDEQSGTTESENAQRESEMQLMLEIDGMIHDETRSKIGRDFYNVFYSNWQSPPDARNFTINVSEQPSPSMGTIIYVKVNDTETFRMRLQPRYDFIQQAGEYAVRQTYRHLLTGDHHVQIY